MSILKLQGARVNYDIETFVGRSGTIFYGPDDGSFRLSDGLTPGGIALSAAGGDGSGYILPTATASVKGGVKIDGTTIAINNQVISVLNGVFTTSSYNNPSFITNLAYSKLTGAPVLAPVATSGSYNDLSNRPTIPTNTDQLTNGAGFITASALSGLATENFVTTRGFLTDIPEASASTKGGFKLGIGLTKDANGIVDAFSGSYNDLTDRPSIPTDINQLSDSSGLLGGGGGGSFTLSAATESTLGGIKIGSGLAIDGSGVVTVTVSVVTSYNELTDTPTIPGDISDLTDTGNLLFNGSYNSLTDTPTIPADVSNLTDTTNLLFSKSYNDLNNLPSLFSGSYTDLSDRPFIPDVGILTFVATTIDTADSSGINFTPLVTFNSDVIVENDLVVSNVIRTVTGEIFATQTFVHQAVSNLVGSAPAALDTLQELAAALNNDENFATTLLSAITSADSAVRFDTASQNLTEQQKQNARTNIDAVSAADVYAAAIVMG